MISLRAQRVGKSMALEPCNLRLIIILCGVAILPLLYAHVLGAFGTLAIDETSGGVVAFSGCFFLDEYFGFYT